jgi:uncharacterized BrkB/YihY/UPF0761 family membrane protein
MASGADASGLPSDERSLAEILGALANQPVGDSWVEQKRARALAFAERATTRGRLAGPAEIGWQVNRRLRAVGSGALAALIAYRVFVWLLPLAVALVLAFGLYSSLADVSTKDVVQRAGLTGYFASSVAGTASETHGFGRWLGLVLALLFLLYQSYALFRAAVAVHALVWGLPLVAARRPLVAATLTLVLTTGGIVAAAALRTVPDYVGTGPSVVALCLAYALPFVAWLLVSTRLPHRARTWVALVPGAVVVGVAFVALHAFDAFLLVPWLESRQETYGVLGVAAGVLFSLYFLGWAIAGGAALNRVLQERRAAPA